MKKQLREPDDMTDALLYAMSEKSQPKWVRKELKGVGDNDGYWEVTT